MSAPVPGRFDHAVLDPGAREREVVAAAREAAARGVRGLCVLPYRVRVAARVLGGSTVRCIAVVGFPAAGPPVAALEYEAAEAIRDGAVELDLVLPLGRLRDGAWDAVAGDVRRIRRAAGDPPVKAIVEASEVDDRFLRSVVERVVVPAEATFLKTGTGVYGRPLPPERIAAIRSMLPPGVRLKVSGGIRDLDAARAALGAGADVLGTSRTFDLLDAGFAEGSGKG